MDALESLLATASRKRYADWTRYEYDLVLAKYHDSDYAYQMAVALLEKLEQYQLIADK